MKPEKDLCSPIASSIPVEKKFADSIPVTASFSLLVFELLLWVQGIKISAWGMLFSFLLELFFLMFPFDPLENISKALVFCFQGDQKGTLERKGLKKISYRTFL